MTQHSTSKTVLPGFLIPSFALAAIVCCLGLSTSARAMDSEKLRNTFAEPPREYAAAPLWVWNDRLTEEQIANTMRDLASQGVKQVFVHPRPGLMTPYLSDEWFKLWKIALREAERLDMNVWIYDENSYPSGFAGGFVPEAMPESRGMGLVIEEKDSQIPTGGDLVAVFEPTADGYKDITEQFLGAKDASAKPAGKCLVASLRWAGTSPWYGGKFYVNLLTPGVTEKFLELTMEPYVKNIGDQFGKRVPGVFTDEPQITPAGGLPWSKDLPEVFKKRWGYDLVESLPSLAKPVGDWKRVRHNYEQTLLELFIERWARPYYEYCAKHGLEFTGHYWEHEWPNCTMDPDNMAMYAWFQRPAIDNLMNQYSEDVHGQFGNTRTVKELSSVANQLGIERTLCEAYGAGGWDLRFEDMKRIGDWLYVLGVNTLDPHLSYITIRGARKRDHPQSFSYHEPWWKDYHVMANYFTRLSMILSAGKQINRVLVLEPTTTAWLYQGDGGKLNEIGNGFQKFVMDLERAQVEYDLGSEDIIARHGSAEGPAFKVGQRSYDVVVLPPVTENLNAKTMDLLAAYVEAGGKVLCCGDAPSRIEGRESDRAQAAAKSASWKRIDAAEVPASLAAATDGGFAIERRQDDKGNLFHHRRVVEDGEFVLLVNTSIEALSSGWITAKAGGVEQWDLNTAEVSAYPFEKTDAGVKAAFDLPPCGSLLLFLSKKTQTPQKPKAITHSYVTVQGSVEVTPLEENVLTLDFVDVTAGGESKKNVYFYAANRFAFAKNGMPQNPWDSSVQFKDELITKTFPAGSGVEASYRFTIEGRVPERLWIVIERPDLYKVTCNGETVSARKGQWWLDKAFGRIEIAKAVKVGENVVTIQASPFTIYHELEPAYLLGSFTLKPGQSGFAVVGRSKPAMELGSWKSQGYPFYAAGVSYKEKFNVARPEAGQCLVELDKWYGSVAEVLVNGQPAGHIVSQPWTCDVTKSLKPGTNTIEVRVIGTLKNTLGPHHNGTGLGSAWPGSFQRGPESGPPAGDKYHTVDYGLFSPFALRQTVTE